MRMLLFISVIASVGCLRSTQYRCATNDQCGAEGQCEATSFCSFPDGACTDGRRYGEYSGDLAGKCVGEVAMTDGGVQDMSTTTDVPTNACPGSYSTIAGVTNRRYRVIGNAAAFATQKAACAADGSNTYLAIPDDQAELTAILNAANTFRIWVGIEDVGDNDMFVTVKGAPFPASNPLWDQGEPDDNPFSGGGAANCAVASNQGDDLADDRCAATYAAVCECEP